MKIWKFCCKSRRDKQRRQFSQTELTWHKCLGDKPIWIASPSQNCLLILEVVKMWTQVCFDNMAVFFTKEKEKKQQQQHKTFERPKVLLKHHFEEKFNKLSWIFDCNSWMSDMEISKAIFIQISIAAIWIDFSFQHFICKDTSPSRNVLKLQTPRYSLTSDSLGVAFAFAASRFASFRSYMLVIYYKAIHASFKSYVKPKVNSHIM